MIVEVAPRLREYEPYAFWLLGTPVVGYHCCEAITPSQRLAVAWKGMMARCYDCQDTQYSIYGGAGVSVCKRWHQVGNYITDVQKLYGWRSKLSDWAGYHLDKDYYGSNQYAPDTCVWLSLKANAALRGLAVYVTNPYGTRTLYLSRVEVERATRLARRDVQRNLASGMPVKKGKHKGYKFEPALDAGNKRHQLVGEGT